MDSTLAWQTAVKAMQQWKCEGRSMPLYVFANGAPYVAYLLGLHNGALDGSNPLNCQQAVNVHHPGLWDKLAGPNGWAVLATLIARKGLYDEKPSTKATQYRKRSQTTT